MHVNIDSMDEYDMCIFKQNDILKTVKKMNYNLLTYNIL